MHVKAFAFSSITAVRSFFTSTHLLKLRPHRPIVFNTHSRATFLLPAVATFTGMSSVERVAQLPQKMNAVYTDHYGSPENVLQFKQVPVPQIKPDQLLVKISAAAAHAGDWRLIRASPFIIRFMFGFLRPSIHIPGCDMCGVVEAVGEQVTDYKVGDIVFGDISSSGFGTFAEYVAVPSTAVVHKPENVPVEDAAVSGVSAIAALQAVKSVDMMDKKVLINGASGGVGTFTIQMAKHLGAEEVWVVCNGRKAEVLKSLGATHVIDYTQQNMFDVEEKFDVVIDNACHESPKEYAKIIGRGGKLVVVGGTLVRFFESMLVSSWMAKTKDIEVTVLQSSPSQELLTEIAGLLSSGAIKPHIDREFALEETAKALKYVEDRKVTGKVLIKP